MTKSDEPPPKDQAHTEAEALSAVNVPSSAKGQLTSAVQEQTEAEALSAIAASSRAQSRNLANDADPTSLPSDAVPTLPRNHSIGLKLLADWLHPWKPYATPFGLLFVVLVVLGIYLRLFDFGYPKTLQFDEHHFVETARGYLKHQPDWNDHPPLGKLLIASSISRFGDNSFAFRLPALISGILTIVLGAIAARRLFGSRWAATTAAALLAADGFLIAYSRAALLDGFLATLSLAALVMVGFEVSLVWGCIAGLVLGTAASIKFSGIAVLLPLLFVIAVAKRDSRSKFATVAAMVTVAAIVYVSSYSTGLSMTAKPNGVSDVIADTQRLLKHHADLTDMKNPATSGWITWALPTKPLMLGFAEKHGAVRALSTLGNLATWWGSVILLLLSIATILRLGWSKVLEPDQGEPAEPEPVTGFVLEHGRSVIASLLLAIGFLAPWVMTHRDSYIYHFLPVYAPMVVTLAGFLGWYETRRPVRVLVFVVIALLVAAYYAPLWAYVPMSRDALNLRLFVTSWR
jgi:dolichyl-phosphate-mannose--protein O-mannosyl transferase